MKLCWLVDVASLAGYCSVLVCVSKLDPNLMATLVTLVSLFSSHFVPRTSTWSAAETWY